MLKEEEAIAWIALSNQQFRVSYVIIYIIMRTSNVLHATCQLTYRAQLTAIL